MCNIAFLDHQSFISFPQKVKRMDSSNNSNTIHHLSSLVFLILMEELNQPIDNSPVHWDRSRLEWNTHVDLKMFENRFHIMYRMDYDSFIVLYNLLKPYIKRDLSQSRNSEPISNLLIVALGLRYLSGEKIRSLESDFQISKSTCYEVREIFIEAVLTCPQLSINFPSSCQELSSIANGFAEKAFEPIFKGCIGAIDGFSPWHKNLLKLNATETKSHTVVVITGFTAWTSKLLLTQI